MAHSAWTGGSVYTGQAALPHKNIQQFLAEQTQDITEYDEQLVRRLIAKITVYDEKVIVEFKSGTNVDIHR